MIPNDPTASNAMDLRSTYNRIAADWDKDHENDTWWMNGADKLASLLKTGASVLDVGCAAGMKTGYLIKKGFDVTGVDFSEKMIDLARRKIPGRERFFVRDINEPLDLNASFDGIFAQAVLLHIPKRNMKAVIANLVDALKPGGVLYAAVKELPQGAKEEMMVKEKDYGYEYERFFSFFTLEELKEYFEEAGLRIIYDKISSTGIVGKTVWIEVIGQKDESRPDHQSAGS